MQNLNNWCVCALLHMILAWACKIANTCAAREKANTCATREIANTFATRDGKHTCHTRDARHELALGFPHYTCGVTTGTVAVDNEIQLLCSLLASLYVVRSIA